MGSHRRVARVSVTTGGPRLRRQERRIKCRELLTQHDTVAALVTVLVDDVHGGGVSGL